MKCLHIATLHPRHDSRILTKECASLANAGHEVTLLVGDGAGDERYGAVSIRDMGFPSGRFASRIMPMWNAMRYARQASPDVVHFHDPMFLPFSIILAILGTQVVYDVHEDYPRQVLTWRFGWPIRYTASAGYTFLEWVGGFFFKRVVAVTPTIAARFPPQKTVLLRNFPLLGELHSPDPMPMAQRPREFTYVGSITEERNIYAMVEAAACVDGGGAKLRLAGDFSSPDTKRQALQMPEWASVKFEGWVSRTDVAAMLADGRAGLVVLKPVPHEMLTLPIKLFEYMAAAMPVISSDFPLWREIVEEAQCGILIDPTKVDELTSAMQWILDNPEDAQSMGERGRQAVVERYNWDREAETMLAFYRQLDRKAGPA